MDVNTGLAIAAGVVIFGGVIYFLTRKPAGAVPEPPCAEGEQWCDGYNLMECQNGEGVVIEPNCPECGYVPPPSYYVKGFLKDDVTGEPIIGATVSLVELGIEVKSATSGFFIFDIDPITKEPFAEVPEGTYNLQITSRFPYDHEPVTLEIVVPDGTNVGIVEMHRTIPLCNEGERRCAGANLEECQNGQWVVIETSSPECSPEPEPARLNVLYFYKLIGQWIPKGENFGFFDMVVDVQNSMAINVNQWTCNRDRTFDIVTEVTFPDGNTKTFNSSINVKANRSAGTGIGNLGVTTEGEYNFRVELYERESGVKLHQKSFTEICTIRI